MTSEVELNKLYSNESSQDEDYQFNSDEPVVIMNPDYVEFRDVVTKEFVESKIEGESRISDLTRTSSNIW
jgi:hypothetical protein